MKFRITSKGGFINLKIRTIFGNRTKPCLQKLRPKGIRRLKCFSCVTFVKIIRTQANPIPPEAPNGPTEENLGTYSETSAISSPITQLPGGFIAVTDPGNFPPELSAGDLSGYRIPTPRENAASKRARKKTQERPYLQV